MKLNQKIQIKRTKKLFDNTYKYKAVIVCLFAGFFRGNNLQFAQQKLKEVKKTGKYPLWAKKASISDVEYALEIYKTLSKMKDYALRIESPIISFYSNDISDIKNITEVNLETVKYVSLPDDSQTMAKDTIYVRNLDYGFKVTMGRTTQSHNNFINWINTNPQKIRMPKRCLEDLNNPHSWGGGYFYVKDEKTLTMVRMFLGNSIARVDNVVKLPKI